MENSVDLDYEFITRLKNLPFVEKIILFGSRARGDQASRSDIDLAIVCPQASESEWFDLLQIIDTADTLLKIDCVRFDELPAEAILKKNIETDGVTLYEKNSI